MDRSIIRVAASVAVAAISLAVAAPAQALMRSDPGGDLDAGGGGGGTTTSTSTTGTVRGECPAFSGGSTTGSSYRVSLAGFYAKTQTYDNAFQTDGKGDEVFLSYRNVVVAADGAVLADGENVTGTMGDTNGFSYREKAGTLSSLGGIRSDDCHRTNRILWQGPLASGQKAVISPTMWEWDGGGDGFAAWAGWSSELAGRLSSEAETLFDPLTGTVISLVDIGLSAVASMPIGAAGDKQVGSRDNPDGTKTFQPKLVTFDRAGADYLIANNAYGMGAGIVPVSYFGTNDHGLYTLYLRVERV